MKRNKMIIVIIAAVLIAGIGFGAGMMVKPSTASAAKITADEAKQIALSSVGVSADKANFTKSVFDEGVYEIDFYTSSNEYDFEINGDTGAIIEREVSPRDLSLPDDDGQQSGDSNVPFSDPQNDNDVYSHETEQAGNSAVEENTDDDVIGVAAAKDIAIKHAGVNGASFTKAYLDYDDGIRVYDIEFTAGNKEYDYEINAYSGKIIEYDVDRLEYDDDDDDDD